MKLGYKPVRATTEPIIALIDVVFFLLVFFMLIGRMDATAPFEVEPPEAMGGVDMPGGGETLSIAADGALALNGAEVTQAQVLDALAGVLEADPDRLIRINAHKATQLREVLPLAAEIEAMGARDVVLVVTPGPP